MTNSRSVSRASGVSVFAACCTIALAAALLDLTVLWRAKSRYPMMTLSPDYVWTVPVALLAIALGLAAAAVLLGMWRRETGAFLALFACATVAFLDIFLHVPRLSPYAALLLATGSGLQLARFIGRDGTRVRRTARVAPVLLVALVALVAFIRTSVPTDTAGAPTVSSPGPNVLLITLDTVRAASLSVYGYERDTTPQLARFARRGAVFNLAFSTAPWTLPSHGSLFTGRFPHELSTDYGSPLDDRYPTLAEHFQRRGYATGGFVANMEYCGRYTGLQRGFAHYEDYPKTLGQVASNSTLLRSVADNFSLRRLLRNDEHLNRVTAAEQNRRLLAWLARQNGAPFFAFVNYFDAHEPYLPPAPFDRKFGAGRKYGRHSPVHHAMWNPAAARGELSPDDLREEHDAYDNALSYLDTELGRLFDELDQRGILENTLVVITSDHGEEFGEHRVLQHGYSLYRRSLEVPLIIALPGVVPAATRVSEPVSLRDIPATIVDATGATDAPFPGTSLRDLWGTSRDGQNTQGRPLLSELKRPPGDVPEWYPVAKGDMTSVLQSGVRYIRNGDGREELYDVALDPLEQRNVISDPDYRAELDRSRLTLATLLGTGNAATNSR